MSLLMPATVMVAVAGQFAFEHKTCLPLTIVVMVGDDGVHQDDCTSQHDHYLRRQVLHYMYVMRITPALADCISTLQRYNF